jgi:hypothetical protein
MHKAFMHWLAFRGKQDAIFVWQCRIEKIEATSIALDSSPF